MPGLIRGVARTAVVAGTASAVSGRVQRRQQGRWAAQEQAAAAEQAPEPVQYAPEPAQYAEPPAASGGRTKLAQVTQLGELRDAGFSPRSNSRPRRARSSTPLTRARLRPRDCHRGCRPPRGIVSWRSWAQSNGGCSVIALLIAPGVDLIVIRVTAERSTEWDRSRARVPGGGSVTSWCGQGPALSSGLSCCPRMPWWSNALPVMTRSSVSAIIRW